MKEGFGEVAASALDMDMAVSRTTSLHCRQPHSHTCSCFLELVIQVFRLLVHRATLTGPQSCQTRSHTQECPRATQAFNRHKFSLLESQPTCSDNLPTHTNTTCLDSQPTLGCTAATFTSHQNSHCVHRPHAFFTHQTYQCHHLWDLGSYHLPERPSLSSALK